MRHTRAIAVALVLGSCASNTTTLDVEALGEPGTTVWFGDMSTTIDSTGHARLVVPPLHIVSYAPGEIAIVNARGTEVSLRFERAAQALNVVAVCLPPVPTDGGTIDGAHLLLRRIIASGECELVAPSVDQNGATITGSYDPSRFDDAPCGPFR